MAQEISTERHGGGVAVLSLNAPERRNALTVAIHPLSGASRLDAFNSAFGRLAVTCTRATHGLLMVARDGVDDLLQNSPAVPGTPFGEPGVRSLPRQTHTRILDTFTRMKTDHRN